MRHISIVVNSEFPFNKNISLFMISIYVQMCYKMTIILYLLTDHIIMKILTQELIFDSFQLKIQQNDNYSIISSMKAINLE